ncbi:MAG: sugar ABC transporter ATP-binding protein [Gemmatimonadaceae bacterium]|nr:sugar ABC transporter ATP-binding protein [Gemmatimonadaceae bacterium]
MSVPRIRFRRVTKRFPGMVALRDVSFDVAPGSCHAICGENGAGKSTLGRILAGLHQPDAGTVEIDGVPVHFASPRDALAAGVAMVHQELAFCDNLTVGDNLSLRSLPQRYGFIRSSALRERALELLEAAGASIDPDRRMASLSVAEQQLVQIAAAVGEGAKVIIFDEPTSSLGDAEAERLYALMQSLRSRGVTQLFVSHRMGEIYRLCDTITVLRDGQHVDTRPATSLSEATLVRQMIGRELGEYFATHGEKPRGPESLRVEHFTSPGHFTDVSFAVHAGEVVGLAGLVGAGRSEIARAIFGLDPSVSGQAYVRGKPVTMRSPRDAMRHGIGLVPEDRKKQGLVLGMRTRENATLPTLSRFARGGWVNRRAEGTSVQTSFARVALRAGPEAPVASLSGGNQQKVVLAKWLTAESDLLILDEPTRGVDVGAKAELHAWIDQRAAEGAAVLLISSELPELLTLSSRILVLREGQLRGELSRAEATQDALLRMMTGLGLTDGGLRGEGLRGEQPKR